jgi:ABC-type antimicrobial peptide transport system permease subunit
MQNSDIVKILLCALALSFTAYAAYLSWRIKRLDRRIELHAEQSGAAGRTARPSPAE